MSSGIKIIAKNKKARHDFFIEETYESGISLVVTEVKSIRIGKVNLHRSSGGNYLFSICISVLMKWEIFLIGIH